MARKKKRTYEVDVWREIRELTTVEVEATSEEEAEGRALEASRRVADGDWVYSYLIDDGVDAVNEVD